MGRIHLANVDAETNLQELENGWINEVPRGEHKPHIVSKRPDIAEDHAVVHEAGETAIPLKVVKLLIDALLNEPELAPLGLLELLLYLLVHFDQMGRKRREDGRSHNGGVLKQF